MISKPESATQHITAGPYSPVLEISCKKLVVISGQTAVALDGTMMGDTIEEQTRFTLLNCAKQLNTAGCDLRNVFKCNIYMNDLNEWEQMNGIYSEIMPELKPVRTAIQAKLLPGVLIEIEMWAAKE